MAVGESRTPVRSRVISLVRTSGLVGWAGLLIPGVAFLLVFFVAPLAWIVVRSFTDPSPANYREFVDSSVFVRSLLLTLRTALLVTSVCLLLGYAFAYGMHHSGPKVRAMLLIVVFLPFWSSLLVRTYAWTVLLRDTGVVNYLLLKLGLIAEPLTLMRNTLGVVIGMTHVLLPFMVLPIYGAMRRVDRDLVPAAESLGARPLTAFRRVLLPLSLPGVFAGCLLVFVLAVGFYITPAVLGGARNPMFSQLIVTEVGALLKFGLGSALAVILLVVTLALVALGSRVVRLGRVFGYEAE